MEDELNILGNGRQHQYFEKKEDKLNMLANGSRPQYFGK
jgi:hypothetical protein